MFRNPALTLRQHEEKEKNLDRVDAENKRAVKEHEAETDKFMDRMKAKLDSKMGWIVPPSERLAYFGKRSFVGGWPVFNKEGQRVS